MDWLTGWACRKKVIVSASSSQATWAASTAKTLGMVVRPTTSNGFFYYCTVAGTTGTSEPTWPTTVGNTVTDGGVTWKCENRYIVPFKIGESPGASGYDFHLDGQSASFPSGLNQGGDLRFTKSDGTTLLDFWVESVSGSSPNRTANIFVETVGDLSQKDIYCYLKNSGASNYSNGSNTFLYFEDFNSYTDGNLTGQGGWTGTTSLVIQETTVYEGAKAAKHPGGITPSNTHSVTLPPSIELTVWVQSAQTNVTTGTAQLIVDSGLAAAEIHLYNTGYIRVHGSTWVADGTYSANEWFKIYLQMRESDLYVRGGKEGSFTSWTSPYQTTPIVNLRLRGENTSAICYWDLITIRQFLSNEPAYSSAGSLEGLANTGAMLLLLLN